MAKLTSDRARVQAVWYGMKYRCTCPKSRSYKDYGGRGITVCSEWLDNDKAFIEWAFLNGYKPGLTLDRIDNSKGYSPENCRWTTRSVQQNNTRKNRSITLCGETHNYSEWARILGISKAAFGRRLNSGWNEDRILNEPVNDIYRRRKKPVLQYDLDGVFIRRWDSARDAQKEEGWNEHEIAKCCKGRKAFYKGYMWDYEV